ncbi:MAG: Mur ligase domain-containing protein, partial [Nitrospirota bacterium]
MRLGDLLSECTYEEVIGLREQGDHGLRPVEDGRFSGTDISGIEYDSRRVKEYVLFVAIRGENYDGHNFVGDALKRGAA